MNHLGVMKAEVVSFNKETDNHRHIVHALEQVGKVSALRVDVLDV